MKIFAMALLLPLLAGCSASHYISAPQQPGFIAEHTSASSVREVSMTPGWLYESRDMLLGAFWNDQMGDHIIITAATPTVSNFSRKPLRITIDSELIEVQPVANHFSSFEMIDYAQGGLSFRSYQNYRIKRELLERMLNADKVVMRAELFDYYIDGQLVPVATEQNKYPGMMAFIRLQEFLEKVDGV